jgi:pyrrolidone-carboxylate peptidase
LEADLSPSRASTTRCNVALDAQNSYTTANLNRGGGRTEETSDRVNQQQIDRSRNRNRTQACGTEIAAGTASAYGWTTLPAERQAAAIEMRAGQNDGPLPFEASFDFGDTIINRALATAKRWIRRLRGKIKGVFCNKVYVIRKSWNIFLDKEIIFLEEIIFLDKENQDGGANDLIFQSRPPTRPYSFEQEG